MAQVKNKTFRIHLQHIEVRTEDDYENGYFTCERFGRPFLLSALRMRICVWIKKKQQKRNDLLVI